MSGSTSARKAEHLRASLSGDVASTATTGLERYRLTATALPERDLADVTSTTRLLGVDLAAPLLISCMTGGTSEAGPLNRALAVAAQEHGVALGLGSGRVLLEAEAGASARAGFAVRAAAPDVLLLANLGAAQLAEHGVDGCRRLVELCSADALVIHCNAVQEAVQPGGDTAWTGVLRRIAELCRDLGHPVVVKEVGFGLSAEDVRRLADAGVAAVDVAGAGGTNWARIEGARDTSVAPVAAAFADWGIPTTEALEGARAVLDATGHGGVELIASGGLRHGVDAALCLALGADVAALARGLLAAAAEGEEAAVAAVGALVAQLRIATWAVGVADVGLLSRHHVVAR